MQTQLMTIFVRLVVDCRTILQHMEDEGLLINEQMGFRGGQSTVESCFGLVDGISQATNLGKVAIAVFIDPAKAFNTVSHPLLLNKMLGYGLSDRILKILTSYLMDQSQMVSIPGATSHCKPSIMAFHRGVF